jgi:hypothetical protein
VEHLLFCFDVPHESQRSGDGELRKQPKMLSFGLDLSSEAFSKIRHVWDQGPVVYCKRFRSPFENPDQITGRVFLVCRKFTPASPPLFSVEGFRADVPSLRGVQLPP